MRKRFLCWLIGHAIDPCDCYASECFRCGLTFDYDDPPRCDLGFWLTYYNFRGMARLRTIKQWIKCPDCGGKCGRHDKAKCLPF